MLEMHWSSASCLVQHLATSLSTFLFFITLARLLRTPRSTTLNCAQMSVTDTLVIAFPYDVPLRHPLPPLDDLWNQCLRL